MIIYVWMYHLFPLPLISINFCNKVKRKSLILVGLLCTTIPPSFSLPYTKIDDSIAEECGEQGMNSQYVRQFTGRVSAFFLDKK